jgi:hypothetical protein
MAFEEGLPTAGSARCSKRRCSWNGGLRHLNDDRHVSRSFDRRGRPAIRRLGRRLDDRRRRGPGGRRSGGRRPGGRHRRDVGGRRSNFRASRADALRSWKRRWLARCHELDCRCRCLDACLFRPCRRRRFLDGGRLNDGGRRRPECRPSFEGERNRQEDARGKRERHGQGSDVMTAPPDAKGRRGIPAPGPTHAARTVRQRRFKRRGAPDGVSPARSARQTIMEVRSGSRARRRASLGRETPRTPGGNPIRTSAFVIPVPVADVAVMRVHSTHEHVVAAATHGTFLGVDDGKVPRAVKGGDRTRHGGRARVLPAMTGLAPMRMAQALIPDERRIKGRHAGDLRGEPRRPAGAEAPAETLLAHRPSGRA